MYYYIDLSPAEVLLAECLLDAAVKLRGQREDAWVISWVAGVIHLVASHEVTCADSAVFGWYPIADGQE